MDKRRALGVTMGGIPHISTTTISYLPCHCHQQLWDSAHVAHPLAVGEGMNNRKVSVLSSGCCFAMSAANNQLFSLAFTGSLMEPRQAKYKVRLNLWHWLVCD